MTPIRLLWMACALGACSSSGGPVLEACRDIAGPGEACIAGGTFVMGHDPIPDPRVPLAQIPQLHAPAHRVRLPPFFIDARPVTNGEYLACLQAGACPDECQTSGTQNSVGSTSCASGSTFYYRYHVGDATLANHPVATVFDVGAAAYCAWVGRRLPTEAEWERAARGPNGTDYPWGDEAPDCSRYGCDLIPLGDPSTPFIPVGAYPVDRVTGDVSPEGIRFMVTGVPEFLDDWYYDYPFDNGQAIPSPRGEPFSGSNGQSARGNVNARLPLYRGESSLPPDQAHEPFPQPAWVRSDNSWLGRGGFRCARDDR